jgi:hypothetical protein
MEDICHSLELTSAMAEWIEDFYNSTWLGYLTPTEYEALHLEKAQAGFS